MSKQELSPVKKVRRQSGEVTENRRNIALLSALGLIDFIPISLYQLGVIRHLPDLPAELFDSDFVNASKDAQVAGMPDGSVSLLMYAANLVLITGAIKKKNLNWVDYIIAGNVAGQAAGGAYYLYNMATKQKKICLYCLAGAAVNFISLVQLYKMLKDRG
ncbi:MAG: vitamin K epoxide reductase family protein [Balneolaceae bacterium]